METFAPWSRELGVRGRAGKYSQIGSCDVVVRAIKLRPHVLPIEEIDQIIRWRPHPDLLASNP